MFPFFRFIVYVFGSRVEKKGRHVNDNGKNKRRGWRNLNPIAIRIKHKRHSVLGQPLLPPHPFLLEPRARGVYIIDGNANMAESLRVGIAVVVGEIRVFFGAVVPGEFEQTLVGRGRVVTADGGRGGFWGVAEKIEVEPTGSCLKGSEKRHA